PLHGVTPCGHSATYSKPSSTSGLNSVTSIQVATPIWMAYSTPTALQLMMATYSSSLKGTMRKLTSMYSRASEPAMEIGSRAMTDDAIPQPRESSVWACTAP